MIPASERFRSRFEPDQVQCQSGSTRRGTESTTARSRSQNSPPGSASSASPSTARRRCSTRGRCFLAPPAWGCLCQPFEQVDCIRQCSWDVVATVMARGSSATPWLRERPLIGMSTPVKPCCDRVTSTNAFESRVQTFSIRRSARSHKRQRPGHLVGDWREVVQRTPFEGEDKCLRQIRSDVMTRGHQSSTRDAGCGLGYDVR